MNFDPMPLSEAQEIAKNGVYNIPSGRLGRAVETLDHEVKRLRAGQVALLARCDGRDQVEDEYNGGFIDTAEVRALLGAADPTPDVSLSPNIKEALRRNVLNGNPIVLFGVEYIPAKPTLMQRLVDVTVPPLAAFESGTRCSCGRALPCRHCTQET